MAKTLFRFKLQSLSDVVTNSSSELFVFKNHNMEAVKLTLDALYPDWREEYADPQWVKDLDEETFKDYVSWVFGMEQHRNETWFDRRTEKERFQDWVEREKDNPYANYYKKLADDLNEDPAKLYSNWDTYNPYDNKWENQFIEFTEFGMSKLREHFGDDIALYSFDDNPNWEYQEKLMEVANRYHLG